MSYEFYKIIHLVSLVLVAACLGVSYFSETPKKWARILGMSSSLLLLVAGMGMLARKGFGWPMWINLKLVIWLILAVAGPIMARKLQSNRGKAFSFLMVLFTAAILLVVLKPF